MRKFKLQIIATLGMITTLIIAVLISLNFYSFRNESIDLTKKILSSKNQLIKVSLTEKFNNYKQLLSSVKMSPSDSQEGTFSPHLSSELNYLADTLGQAVEGVYIFNRHGDLFDKHGAKLSINVKSLGRSYYNALFSDRETYYISEPFQSAVTGKDIISVAYKLNESNAVLATIKVQSILDAFNDRHDMFIYSKKGTIIFSPYPELLNKHIFDERPLYTQFSASKPELSYSAVVRGKEIAFTAFWNQLDVTGWGYVVFTKDSVINKNASEQLIASIIIGLISLIVSVIVLLIVVN